MDTKAVRMKYMKSDPTNQLIFPKLPPKDRVREYNESKHVKTPTRTKFLYKEPANIELEVHKRKRELGTSNIVLKHIMAKAKELRKNMDVEWANLKDKEIEFRNSIIYFDNFVVENREKRVRALKKIYDEKQVCQQRSTDMQKLQEKMNTLQYIKAKREEQIRQYKIYEIFLYSVVSMRSREYKDVEAVMVRYDILRDARNDIIASQEAQVQEMSRYKQQMTEILEQKRMKMLRLSVTASDLLTRWGRAKYQALHWENVLNAIKEKVIRQHANIESVKVAADNLYSMLCFRRDLVPKPNATIEDKLYFIKASLGNFKRILNATMSKKKKVTHVQTKKKT